MAATSAQSELQDCRIFPTAHGLVVTPPHTHLVEAERQIETDCRGIRGPHFEEGLSHAGRCPLVEQIVQHAPANPLAAESLIDAQVQDVSPHPRPRS